MNLNFWTAIMVVLNVTVVAYFGYLAFYPFNPIIVQPQPYKLAQTVIPQGGVLSYTFHYCRYTDAQVNIDHQLVGAVQIAVTDTPQFATQVTDQSLRLDKGCATTTKLVRIPSHTPPGEYVLEEHADYQVTPFQMVTREFKTEPFTVVGK